MTRTRWQERVVSDRELHHGAPCIKGTRIPVAMIVGSLADGMTYGQIRITSEVVFSFIALPRERVC